MSTKDIMINALEIVEAEAKLGEELDAVHAVKFVTRVLVDKEGVMPELRETARDYKVQLEELNRALRDLEDLEVGSIMTFIRSVEKIMEDVKATAV